MRDKKTKNGKTAKIGIRNKKTVSSHIICEELRGDE